MTGKADLQRVPNLLLDWYEKNARDLPWRIGPAARKRGVRPDPYPVWLCEIMMQQTTIPHGTPYFHKFLERWPTIEALAAADSEDIMAAWAGLGYYARARNLHKCAKELAARGGFPTTEKALKSLPGIGPYTAGAIAAIVYDEPNAAAVDGNVERVMARFLALTGEWKDEKKVIAERVRSIVPEGRSGLFAEAFMDLGATVCTPMSPACGLCPLSSDCAAFAEGEPEKYPIKPKKKKLPERHGHVYVCAKGELVLLERRPDKGLLGGMLGLPTSEWVEGRAVYAPPFEADWGPVGQVRHVFTHFALTLDVHHFESDEVDSARERLQWAPVDLAVGLPSVFAKAFNLAVNGAEKKKARN